jgi:predicted nucleic acid-binding protein
MPDAEGLIMGKGRKGRSDGFVLDSSVTVAWCFPDERAPYPQAVLDSLAATRAFVPSLWPLEVGNSLLVGERRQRSTQADTTHWLGFLNSLPILVDDETTSRAWDETLHLARSQELSVYDAAYLELALRRAVPLASLDERLKAAAAVVGVAEYTPRTRRKK